MGCLYSIEFPNGKRYIGITTHATAEQRFLTHVINLRRSKGRAGALYSALRKYGTQSVVLDTLASGIDDWELLCLAEQEAINVFGTLAPGGYNLTVGGDGVVGTVWSNEGIRNLSQAMKRAFSESSERRQQVGKQTARLWKETDLRERIAAGRAEYWSDPRNREAAAARTKQQMQSAEVKGSLRQAAKKRWQDPEYRAKMSEKARVQMRARMQDPDYLGKIAAGRAKKSGNST